VRLSTEAISGWRRRRAVLPARPRPKRSRGGRGEGLGRDGRLCPAPKRLRPRRLGRPRRRVELQDHGTGGSRRRRGHASRTAVVRTRRTHDPGDASGHRVRRPPSRPRPPADARRLQIESPPRPPRATATATCCCTPSPTRCSAACGESDIGDFFPANTRMEGCGVGDVPRHGPRQGQEGRPRAEQRGHESSSPSVRTSARGRRPSARTSRASSACRFDRVCVRRKTQRGARIRRQGRGDRRRTPLCAQARKKRSPPLKKSGSEHNDEMQRPPSPRRRVGGDACVAAPDCGRRGDPGVAPTTADACDPWSAMSGFRFPRQA